MWQKLKSLLLNDQAFYSALIVLVGIVSFLLGRFSVIEPNQSSLAEVHFSTNSELAAKLEPSLVTSASDGQDIDLLVASKTGTKYHWSNCPGAKQIKPENRISFSSVAAAVAAGYTPASNCPGLK